MDWLDVLRSANMDDKRLQAVLLERPDLHVEVALDQLAADIEAGQDKDCKAVRSVLLVAHAGDGKTHFLRSKLAATSSRPVYWFPHDGSSAADLERPGIHVFNDPSPTSRDLVLRFFHAAFGEAACDPDRRFVASANRGLLRGLVHFVDKGTPAAAWLRGAHALDAAAHRPDSHGRIAVPLDQRTLVPAPGGGLTAAPCYKLLVALFDYAHEDLGAPAWSPPQWAKRVAVALAMVEACGHHVTFREATALGAAVGRALCLGEREGWSALFQEGDDGQALLRVRSLLRRLDPARVATPALDEAFTTLSARDAAVRLGSWDALVDLFEGGSGETPELPYPSAVPFIQLCARVGQANTRAVAAVRALSDLDAPDAELSQVLEHAVEGLRRSTVGAGEDRLGNLFRGLARVAWGAEGATLSHDVLPLATPLQPGTAVRAARWRVLRAAIGRERAHFSVLTVDPGPYVERGLILPELVIEGPADLDPTPPLRLDLELFDLLARIGDSTHPVELGSRGPQVASWLESVVRTWESAWSESGSGFVVFQTLIDGSASRESVPLRPPKRGEELAEVPLPALEIDSVLDVVREIWPAQSVPSQNLAVTPGACANALLLWAGLSPAHAVPQAPNPSPSALREALGTGHLNALRVRTRYRSVAFPWSTHFLGLTLDHQGRVSRDALDDLRRLGAAIARTLGLGPAWRDGLRGAWARDEPDLDRHPSSLLAHDWLSVGAAGLQLQKFQPFSAPSADPAWPIQEVLAELLGKVPFGGSERWWLVGTLGAWALMNGAVREIHGLDVAPLWLPSVGSPAAKRAYNKTITGWLPDGPDPAAITAIGQASGFLTPPSLLRQFNLSLSAGPGLVDLLRLAAWRVCLNEPQHRTVERLQELLLALGLFTKTGGNPVSDRLPAGAVHEECPPSASFEEALRSELAALSLLDTASDGASLIRSPWSAQ